MDSNIDVDALVKSELSSISSNDEFLQQSKNKSKTTQYSNIT